MEEENVFMLCPWVCVCCMHILFGSARKALFCTHRHTDKPIRMDEYKDSENAYTEAIIITNIKPHSATISLSDIFCSWWAWLVLAWKQNRVIEFSLLPVCSFPLLSRHTEWVSESQTDLHRQNKCMNTCTCLVMEIWLLNHDTKMITYRNEYCNILKAM